MPRGKFDEGDQFVLNLAKKTDVPIVLLLNKIDLIPKERLLPLIAQYKELHEFVDVIPISALKEKGLDTLLDVDRQSAYQKARAISRRTRSPISPNVSWCRS